MCGHSSVSRGALISRTLHHVSLVSCNVLYLMSHSLVALLESINFLWSIYVEVARNTAMWLAMKVASDMSSESPW